MDEAMENQSLILDLVEWVAREPRSYRDVMDAWRTSCPRLTIWEDANDHGFLARADDGSGRSMVHATDAGLRLLREQGRLD
jgi:hypothetical protein